MILQYVNDASQSTLIVGGSRGIGAAAVRRFVSDGHSVAATHRGSGVPSGADSILADLRDVASLEAAVSHVLETRGRIDNLIIAGGITQDALLLRQTDAQLRQVVETNLIGPIQAVKAGLKPMLRARAGSIVLVGSISARLGVAGQTNYTASKGGLEGFASSFAREYAGRGIRINVVAPGPTDTEMMSAVPDAERRAMEEAVPLGRLGRPEEIADVIYWVSQSTFLTGATIPVSGGVQLGY